MLRPLPNPRVPLGLAEAVLPAWEEICVREGRGSTGGAGEGRDMDG